jgi:AraC-like DNA-binding protein
MNTVFYEIEHGTSSNHFLFERNVNHSFPLHMHRCYEMVLVQEGEMIIQIDKKKYCLQKGDLMLIKPNRLHSYLTESDKSSVCLLCVFSSDLIAAISDPLTKYKLKTVVLHDLPPLYREVFALMGAREDLASIKGFLYLLCALFYEQVEHGAMDEFSGDLALLHKMFVYIETNVDKSCTLHELAGKLKYNEAYLSRVFTKYVSVPYSDYVRSIKLNYAGYLLQNTDISVCDVAMKCGYTTQSSFNRSFKQLMACTPGEYRARAKHPGKHGKHARE